MVFNLRQGWFFQSDQAVAIGYHAVGDAIDQRKGRCYWRVLTLIYIMFIFAFLALAFRYMDGPQPN